MNYTTLNLLFKYNKEFSHEKIRLQELSDTECMICSYIYSHDNCSQDEVALALKTDKTTIGKALSSLEKKDCVTRKKLDTDMRVKHLSLTPKGIDKISGLINLHDNWLNEILKVLSPEEQKQFENYCERLLLSAEELANKK